MTHHDPRGPSAAAAPSDSGEFERLSHSLAVRFEPHLQAAAALVRSAEQDLAEAKQRLQAARDLADSERYRSDPLVFMRASVHEEVEALDRKTTEKKVRAAFRYLVDRAVELAEGEVRGYSADQSAAARERESGVTACEDAQREAENQLSAALQMQQRVLYAQSQAGAGLALMMSKLSAGVEQS